MTMKLDLRSLTRLFPLLCPYRGGLAAAVLLTLAGVGASLVPPWVFRISVDTYVAEGSLRSLRWAALTVMGAALLQGILSFVSRYAMEYLGQKIVFDLRDVLYKHINTLSFSFFDSARTGDLLARVTSDTEQLNRLFGFASVNIISNSLTLVGIFGVLFAWDVRLALIYAVLVPFMAHAMYMYGMRVRPVFQQARRSFSRLTEMARESMLGIETVKVLGQESHTKKRFQSESQSYCRASIVAGRLSALWMPYVSVLMGLGTGLVLLVGGYWVIVGDLSMGLLVGFIGYVGMLMRPIRQTGMMVHVVNQSTAAAERVFEVLDRKPAAGDKPDAYDLPEPEGRVEYRDVSFAYDDGEPVLRDINLSVNPGKIIAVVGPVGSGKSTLLHLLPRFYPLQQGSICIDGHDVGSVTLESLRRQVGVVLQDTFLFDGTVAENIAFGRPDASLDDVRAAAELAQLDEFIQTLPGRYHFSIGPRGGRLSGGQKQRLAIARVLLTDPKILVMDEATSSMDTATEEKLQAALLEVIRGRTVFVIAHRLWTVRLADRIIVMDKGRIAEEGRHDELLQTGGWYAFACEHQFAGTVSTASKTQSGGDSS